MKKTWIIALSMLASGCQKELSTVLEPGMPDNRAGLLQKVVVASQPQNDVYLEQFFSYDDSGRTAGILVRAIMPSGGVMQTQTSLSNFVRDPLGRATTIQYTPGDLATKAVLTYRGTTNQLNHVTLWKIQAGQEVVVDSLVYSYSNTDHVARTDQYVRQADGRLVRVAYQEYGWDARGNLLYKQTYQDNDGNGLFESSIRYNWSYDDKPNPRPFNDPAVFYWTYLWPTGGSANNIVRQANIYPVNGGPDDTLNFEFQYNPDNTPRTETQIPTGNFTRYIYY